MHKQFTTVLTFLFVFLALGFAFALARAGQELGGLAAVILALAPTVALLLKRK